MYERIIFFLLETLIFISLSHIHLEQPYLLDLEILHFSHELRFLLCSPHPYKDSFFWPIYPPLCFDLPNFWEINYGTQSQNTKACYHGEEVISLTYSYSSNSNSKTPQTSISVTCPGTSVLMHTHIHIYWMTYKCIHITYPVFNIIIYCTISYKYFPL